MLTFSRFPLLATLALVPGCTTTIVYQQVNGDDDTGVDSFASWSPDLDTSSSSTSAADDGTSGSTSDDTSSSTGDASTTAADTSTGGDTGGSTSTTGDDGTSGSTGDDAAPCLWGMPLSCEVGLCVADGGWHCAGDLDFGDDDQAIAIAPGAGEQTWAIDPADDLDLVSLVVPDDGIAYEFRVSPDGWDAVLEVYDAMDGSFEGTVDEGGAGEAESVVLTNYGPDNKRYHAVIRSVDAAPAGPYVHVYAAEEALQGLGQGGVCDSDDDCAAPGWCTNNVFDDLAPYLCTVECDPADKFACNPGVCVGSPGDFRCSGAWNIQEHRVADVAYEPPSTLHYEDNAILPPAADNTVVTYYVPPQPVDFEVSVSDLEGPNYGPSRVDVYRGDGTVIGPVVAGWPLTVPATAGAVRFVWRALGTKKAVSHLAIKNVNP